MKKNSLFQHRNLKAVLFILLPLLLCSYLTSETLAESETRRGFFGSRLQKWKESRDKQKETSDEKCDSFLSVIQNGYGSTGTFQMGRETFRNPVWRRGEIAVFYPKGVNKKTPVIFFAHGYGAKDWRLSYGDLVSHIVSKGYTVVYSPYQTFMADFKERYETLWKGFELAAEKFKTRIDLTRVGFVGHSFGGGATPAMAYKGLVEKKWGENGAFMFIMAPWYSFELTTDKLSKLPQHTFLLIQIYDKDSVNDHRMAVDLYRNIKLPQAQKSFEVIRSVSINSCELTADHATPNRNPSLMLKTYAVFRPLDALTDYIFNMNKSGRDFLLHGLFNLKNAEYQPVELENSPSPAESEETYRFPWSDKRNPRSSLIKWN